ncbi:MAG TPA: hypothetical protein VHU16_01575, partial [Candidatus Udaeobacter sp.]|nr:hypothetical protein [Candidatus Udaeobacter sp.]
MKNRTKYTLTTLVLLFVALVVYMLNPQRAYAAPTIAPATGPLFYTTYCNPGGVRVWSIQFDYDGGTNITYTNKTGLAQTPGADGIIFDTSDPQPNRYLLIGGQANQVYRVDTTTGSFTSVTTPTS